MKQLLITIFFLTEALIAQSQNTLENTPHNGQDPCERPAQIVTNPFAPQNTEWNTMRNRFNWMDYVTLHGNWKGRIPYFDIVGIYGGGSNSIQYFINPFFDINQDYLSHINLKNNWSLFFTLGYENDFNSIKLFPKFYQIQV